MDTENIRSTAILDTNCSRPAFSILMALPGFSRSSKYWPFKCVEGSAGQDHHLLSGERSYTASLVSACLRFTETRILSPKPLTSQAGAQKAGTPLLSSDQG